MISIYFSLNTHQIQIPSISKLSINPTTKISQNSVSSVTNQTSDHPRRVFGRTSTAELLQASVGNQLRKGTTAAGSVNHQGPVTHMTQETTQEGTGTDRHQGLRSDKGNIFAFFFIKRVVCMAVMSICIKECFCAFQS